MKNTITVYSTKLAVKLCQLGYIIINTAPNRKNPRLKVYYFLNQPGLQEEIAKYQANQKEE